MRRKHFIAGILLCAVMMMALLSPEFTRIPKAFAATITVNTTVDEFDVVPNATCSLREAIQSANLNADFGGCTRVGLGNADVIELAAVTYTLTIAGAGENVNATGDLDIIDAAGLTINGNGATIDGGGIDRVLNHRGGATVLNTLTISGGAAPDVGGGIYIQTAGSMVLNAVLVSANTAVNNGGGIMATRPLTLNNSAVDNNSTNAAGATRRGGGIYSQNPLTLNNSFVRNNTTADGMGGGIYSTTVNSTLTLVNTVISGNSSGAANGGGIAKFFTPMTLTNSQILTNTSTLDGGGVFASTDSNVTINGGSVISGNTAGDSGGGIFSLSPVTIDASTIIANNAAAGAGVYVTNTSVTLQNGAAVNGNTSTGSAGGVYANGLTASVTINDTSAVNNNIATGLGAGLRLANGADLTGTGGIIAGNVNNGTTGGGLYGSGGSLVSLNGTMVSGNQTGASGGGLFVTGVGASVTLTNAQILNNTATANGGGIYVTNDATLQVTGTTIQGNITVTGTGGGIILGGAGSATIDGNSQIASNTSATNGGGIDRQGTGALNITNSTIQNNRANISGGGMRVTAGGLATITGSTIQGNTAMNGGGAILMTGGSSLNATNTTFQGNSTGTGSGGAIYASAGGTVTLDTVTIQGNNAAAAGGAMYANNISVTITRSALVANTAGNTGGGIQATDPVAVTITNSTLSGNTAVGPGGGLSSNSTSAHSLNNVTITNNTASVGGGISQAGTAPNITNTIIAGNTAGADTDCSGTFASAGYNLIGNATGCAGFTDPTDQAGTAATPINPLLGPLALNGGPTLNHMPQPGSPALNRGNNATCISPDQRGVGRPIPPGGPCDIGSVEAPFTNTPPIWTLTPPDQTVFVNEVLTLPDSTFTDPDFWQTFTATIDWGDGSPAGNGTVAYVQATQTGTVTWPTHAYATAGVYTASVTISDGIDNDTATFTVTVNPAAVLSKVFAPAAVVIGQPSTLTFTITNPAGNPALTGLVFTDTLPANLVLAANVTAAQCGGTVTGTAGTDTITLSGGTLAAGPSTCTIDVSVVSNTAGTYVNDETNITGLSPNLTDAGLTDTLRVNAPATLSKAFAPDTIFIAEISTLTFTITNPAGNTALNGLAFTDTLPANVTAVAGTESTTCPAGTVTIGGGGTSVSFAGGQITGGATATTCTVQVDVTSNVAGVYTNNTTNLSGVSVNIDPTGLTATLTVVQPQAVLSKAFAPSTIFVGNNSTLNFTITNPAGNPALTGLAFSDTLPVGVTAITVAGNTCGGTADIPGGTAVTLTGGTIGAGPATCTIDVTVTSPTPGSYTNNTTNLSGVSANLDPTGLTATLIVSDVAVLSKAFTPDTILAGNTSTLVFTITNPAGAPAQTGMTFTDTLPAGITATALVSNTCGGTADIPGGTAVTLTGGTIGAGPATCTIEVTVTAGTPGTYTNDTTNISGLSVNLDPTGLTATLTVNQPLAALSKVFTPDTINPGETSTLTFTITNLAGNPALTGLAFTDELPLNVFPDSVGANTCGATVNFSAVGGGAAFIDVTGGAIGAGPATCTIEVIVTSDVPGTYVNNETNLSGVSPNLDPTGLSATLTVTAMEATLSKAFNPAVITAGETSTLIFTITNPAVNPAQTGLAFTDELPLNVFPDSVGANTCGATVNFSAVGGGAAFIDVTGGTIGAGPATCTIEVTVTSDVPGTYVNNETNLSGVSPNLDTTGLSATLTVEEAATQARLSKVFTPSTIQVGATASLTFTITNAVGAPAQAGLSFTDTLPAGVTVSGVPAAAQCGGNVSTTATVITFTGGTLAAGETTCSITVTVTSNTPGVYTNDASNISNLNGLVTGAGITTTLTVTEGPVVPPDDDGPSAEDHARAQAPLCSLIGGGTDPVVRADVQPGTVTDGSVFCRILARDRVFILTPAEVGIQSVVDLGVIHAVDVFGLRHDSLSETHFNLGVKVCLEGTGRLLYLDATQSPRPVGLLASTTEGGYTCGIIPNAGTVVLVP